MTIQTIDDTASVNLKIAHIGNVISADDVTIDQDPIAGTSINNILQGSRSQYYESDTDDHIYNLTFDACDSFAGDFVYIANYKTVIDRFDVASTDVRVRADNSTAYSNTLLNVNVGYANLQGLRGEDYYSEITNSTGYTHWEIRIQDSMVHAVKLRIAKAFVCKLFDFGRDPEYSLPMQQGGAMKFQRHTAKRYFFTWRGVSNDKIDTFNALIMPYTIQTGLVFYDPADAVLGGDRVLFARVVDYGHQALSSNSNTVTMTVEEVV